VTANNIKSIRNKARIKDLLAKLRNKLRNFAIINLQSQVLGRVQDLALDKNYHLNVLMSNEEEQPNSSLYFLSSQYIEKVDTFNRCLVVDLSLTELQQLPVYATQKQEVAEVSGNPRSQSETHSSNLSTGEVQAVNETSSSDTQSWETELSSEEDNEDLKEPDDKSKVVEEEIVRLLEERLIVNRRKEKVGEVVVRKEIETRIIEVPIQREKLIIEQVGAETKQLAEIDLGEGKVTGVELLQARSSDSYQQEGSSSANRYTVKGEFISLKAVSNLLDAIALQERHGCQKVRVELVVDNPELQGTYQQMFDRCSVRS
jgi:stress response protein YsnF